MTHFPCSLLLHCSLGGPFHWPSAVVSPLPGCELSFCSSSLTTSYSTPNFTLEKVLCSTVHSILCGAQRSNCNQVLTKQGVGRKRIKAGLKQDATFSDQMLKFLVFGLGFWTGEGSQRETAPAEPRLTEENEFYCTASSGNFQTCSWCLLLVILCHPCCCKCSHSC